MLRIPENPVTVAASTRCLTTTLSPIDRISLPASVRSNLSHRLVPPKQRVLLKHVPFSRLDHRYLDPSSRRRRVWIKQKGEIFARCNLEPHLLIEGTHCLILTLWVCRGLMVGARRKAWWEAGLATPFSRSTAHLDTTHTYGVPSTSSQPSGDGPNSPAFSTTESLRWTIRGDQRHWRTRAILSASICETSISHSLEAGESTAGPRSLATQSCILHRSCPRCTFTTVSPPSRARLFASPDYQLVPPLALISNKTFLLQVICSFRQPAKRAVGRLLRALCLRNIHTQDGMPRGTRTRPSDFGPLFNPLQRTLFRLAPLSTHPDQQMLRPNLSSATLRSSDARLLPAQVRPTLRSRMHNDSWLITRLLYLTAPLIRLYTRDMVFYAQGTRAETGTVPIRPLRVAGP